MDVEDQLELRTNSRPLECKEKIEEGQSIDIREEAAIEREVFGDSFANNFVSVLLR